MWRGLWLGLSQCCWRLGGPNEQVWTGSWEMGGCRGSQVNNFEQVHKWSHGYLPHEENGRQTWLKILPLHTLLWVVNIVESKMAEVKMAAIRELCGGKNDQYQGPYWYMAYLIWRTRKKYGTKWCVKCGAFLGNKICSPFIWVSLWCPRIANGKDLIVRWKMLCQCKAWEFTSIFEM